MTVEHDVECPGCGLILPRQATVAGHRYIPASPECWSLFSEVLASEYENVVIYSAVHQLTVDCYAVQHAVNHPAKSLVSHLVSLHLQLVDGMTGFEARDRLKFLVDTTRDYPELPSPERRTGVTIFDVALKVGSSDYVRAVRDWAAAVWESWSGSYGAIGAITTELKCRYEVR
ncbi:MAG: DUF5946 family protein [Sphingobium sp.]|uniref:DUF5946 family protein n=1 Tax=Sphingobium sp. CECT 9361 TaxID=2845384 RepID=UPI001E36EEC7|nr:DUF5946 family protein [Sphingobium sp. CECT 9361]CAH0353665.1 hypothetical protein SPH9361_02535 [Sphingobium sp. CECT 9361]